MHTTLKGIAITGCLCCAAVLFAASLGGCATSVPTAPPNMVLAVPGGDVPLTPSAGGPPTQGTAVAAPSQTVAGGSGTSPAPNTSGGLPRSGQYAGTGTVMNN